MWGGVGVLLSLVLLTKLLNHDSLSHLEWFAIYWISSLCGGGKRKGNCELICEVILIEWRIFKYFNTYKLLKRGEVLQIWSGSLVRLALSIRSTSSEVQPSSGGSSWRPRTSESILKGEKKIPISSLNVQLRQMELTYSFRSRGMFCSAPGLMPTSGLDLSSSVTRLFGKSSFEIHRIRLPDADLVR